MFLSPILNDLKICIPSMNAWDALMRSLAAIPLHSPQLGRVHLEVDIWGIDRQMYSLDHSNCIGIQCLSAITSLKRLALPFPEAPSLVAIATSFPSLTQLSLTGVGVHSSTTVYELPPSSFPAVQVLELDSLPLSLALAILQLDLFQLHSIHIEVGKFGDFDPIFSSIAANHSDVESLRIEAGYLEYSTTRPSLGFSELSHLLSSCRHLRKLAIDLSHQVDLKMSWDDLLEIVQTLPLLQELELSNSLKASDDPPCLCNLAELAPHCPTLTRLSMNVDARICDIPEIMTPTRFRSLQCWDVRCSPIIRPAEDVALLLSSIFPAECTVEYVANTFLPAEDVNCWKSVGELLPLLGQARRHERSRIDIASMSFTMAVTAVVESRDLLRIIFNFSECNYENALVNRTWCQEALDLLWYEVSNFVVLARLLLAQNPRAHSLSEPNWCPTASAWDTFYKYSSRVRILHDEDWDSYAYSIFPIMAATRPRRDLFPNLQLLRFQLSVASPLPHLPMLLGSSLRDLQIWIPYMEDQEVWDTLMGSLT
ncbi:hypothetical protein ONZ45_g15574 [Pleurotus djamor]|nr:hypothetical protein ONZ45_g15574 [Pleurotus djamor]